MKRTTLTKIARSEHLTLLIKNKNLIFIYLLFLSGLLCGALVIKSANAALSELIGSLVENLILQRNAQKFWLVFWNAFLTVLPYFLVLFLFGVSPAGPAVVPAVLFIRGLGAGLINGYLYRFFGIKGIAFSALLILPAALIVSFILILASRESFGFSLILARAVLPGSPAIRLSGDFKLYCFRYLFLIGLILIAALVDAVFSVCFLRFFNL